MTLHLTSNFDIPVDTKNVAIAAFPKGNKYIKLRDNMGSIFDDEDFQDLYPKRGQPALAPWRLALVTILQQGECLSDRHAADAVRSRIDWKYLLGLELSDPGFDHSVLSEFRDRLISQSAEERVLDKILKHCIELNILKSGGKQRTDSTHVLTSVRNMNRWELIGEVLRAALNELATIAPAWLQGIAKDDWYKRYSNRIENFRLPRTTEKKQEFADHVGQDSHYLLDKIQELDAPVTLRYLDKINSLKLAMNRHFKIDEETQEIIFKTNKEVHQSEAKIESPYDTEARFRTKRDSNWTGYAVHLTETCDDTEVNLITDVHTTPADVHDSSVTGLIQSRLAAKNIAPKDHLVDTGYMSVEHLVRAKNDLNINMIGKLKAGVQWQKDVDGAYFPTDFQILWDQKKIICPEGEESLSWKEIPTDGKAKRIQAIFSRKSCTKCPTRNRCTKSEYSSKKISVFEKEYYDAQVSAREEMKTDSFKKKYGKRAGIEGTISQGVRNCSLRQSKYIGLAKTHLQEMLNAAAINLFRISDWLMGKPREKTRISAFYELRPKAA